MESALYVVVFIEQVNRVGNNVVRCVQLLCLRKDSMGWEIIHCALYN